jgi:Bacterial Ig-like domain (group 2)
MKTNRGTTAAIAAGALLMSLLALGTLLASCGGGAGMGLRQLVAITVQPGNGQAIEPGGTVSFTATGTFDQAPITQTDLHAEWASSDSSVVTIDPNTGIATCLAVGGPISVTASAAGKGGTVLGSGTLACQVSPDPLVNLDPPVMGFTCSLQGVVCSCTPPQTATLTNVGGATLAIDSIVTVNSFFSQSNTCSASVDAGQSCAITVTFHPNGIAGFLGEVKITDNAANSPQALDLGGSANCVP